MKKALLSGTLIATFILYGLHQRQEDKTLVIVPAVSPIVQSTDTPTPLPTDTPTSTPSATTTPISTSPESTPTPTPKPTPTPTPQGRYKNGTYTGSVADAIYGNIQVQAVISGGKISAVTFLQYPNDRDRSIEINRQAMPYLQQEAISAQSANVNGVSGASDTSAAFIESLGNALRQAA